MAQEVPEHTKRNSKNREYCKRSRSKDKVAVSSNDSKVDPSGACIGQRGVRIQAVTVRIKRRKDRYYKLQPKP